MTTNPQESLDSRLDRITQAIEDLTTGIAQIAQDARVQRLDLAALKELVERQSVVTAQQMTVATQQAETVDRLTVIVDRLLSRDNP